RGETQRGRREEEGSLDPNSVRSTTVAPPCISVTSDGVALTVAPPSSGAPFSAPSPTTAEYQ
ncbi:hypothetical protein U1Q18_027860, partial [Sarracenia purpurea var. burkii]